jgi:methylated-DNA-[protein]-cysteine S-methyltransferase
MSACWDTYESPIGRLTLVEREGRLRAVRFPGAGDSFAAENRRPERLAEAVRQLEQYFGGERRRFELPLELLGSPFEQRVWEELRKIPFGSTLSYGELARRIGRPGQAREVGTAVGRTPVPIVVPCHRVIGADGSLTGYGGGLERKQALLDLERGVLPLGAVGSGTSWLTSAMAT